MQFSTLRLTLLYLYVPNENHWELLYDILQLLWQFVWFPLNELCDFGFWLVFICVCARCQALNETNTFIFLPLFCVKTYHKSGTLLLILLYYIRGDFTLRVCLSAVFFVKFMCHSNSIENYSDYLVFELNSNTSYLGYAHMNGWVEVCHTKDQQQQNQQKRGWRIWHWCNTKTTCIQIHKQMIVCCFDILQWNMKC